MDSGTGLYEVWRRGCVIGGVIMAEFVALAMGDVT